jgi:hypothetical protein
MGAIHFSIDSELVQALRRGLELNTLVETGSYMGDTAAYAADKFADVFTIELSTTIYMKTAHRLKQYKNVNALLGNSAEILQALHSELNEKSVVYWLDAHWCGGETSDAAGECPLLEELAAIGNLNDQSVVLIDDARYFISPPPNIFRAAHWPSLEQITSALAAMTNGSHKMWIINDVIIYAPRSVTHYVVQYGQTWGQDLLDIVHKARSAGWTLTSRPA